MLEDFISIVEVIGARCGDYIGLTRPGERFYVKSYFNPNRGVDISSVIWDY